MSAVSLARRGWHSHCQTCFMVPIVCRSWRLFLPILAACLLWHPGSVQGVKEVYLVPHAHCDAGWLVRFVKVSLCSAKGGRLMFVWGGTCGSRSAQQYFDYGVTGDPVRQILDTVVETLASNPALRFVWSETIWLQKWWPLQTAETQATLVRLVASGQIEIVGGGFVQNDEATTTVDDIVDQTLTGHEFLRSIGLVTDARPVRHGYQIDMFAGYSPATPSLWALMGYEGMVLRFEGTDEQRALWRQQRAFQFVWQGSRNLPVANQSIFAHVIDGTRVFGVTESRVCHSSGLGFPPSIRGRACFARVDA